MGADPDVLGGFEKAGKGGLLELMKRLPKLRWVALTSTYFGWVDLEYCRKMGIGVSNVPHYSTESVAEQTLSLMI